MSISAEWVHEFKKALVLGKQPLLHGNVADLHLCDGQYATVQDYAIGHFRDRGYEIVGVYDIVDGLTFPERDMRMAFERALNRGLTAGEPGFEAAQSTTADGVPTSSEAAEGRPVPVIPAGLSVYMRDPLDAMAAIRRVASQGDVACAFVVTFGDKLVAHADNQSLDERRLLVELSKAVEQAAFVAEGQARGLRNTIALVAARLSQIPASLYQEQLAPLMQLVSVSRPGLEERTAFFQSYAGQFHGGSELSDDEINTTSGVFGTLTDGLSSWDLDALRRASIAEEMPVTRLRELVSHFRHGTRKSPWEQLGEEQLGDAARRLRDRVIGQPAAVDAVVNALVAAKVGVGLTGEGGSRRPKGVLFFAGPTGTGKTELAKAMTQLVFGDESAFARFDMSEYGEAHAAERLAGAPPGFVGYDEGGQLTNRLKTRPFSVLLFDEIEKAHGRVLDRFISLMDEGRITDGQGTTVYADECLLVFTSNIGSGTLAAGWGGAMNLSYEEVEEHYTESVRDHLANNLQRPELFGRLDQVVVFDVLRPESIDAIAMKFLRTLAESAARKCDLSLEIDDSLIQAIRATMLEGTNLAYGGRMIRNVVNSQVVQPLNGWLFTANPTPGSAVVLGAAGSSPWLTVNGVRVREEDPL